MNDENKVNSIKILKELPDLINKAKKVEDIAKIYNITPLEVMGYINKLREKGINISYYEDENNAYVVKNDHPDLAKLNEYHIEEDIDKSTKIGVISDTRFGSKNEQIVILNDIYQKFAKDGVKYVILGGNLIEGPYRGETYMKYGSSLITNDPKSQANHLINYFPRIEGITTLFITGKNDHECSNKMNIGDYINANRTDMIYLGPISATVFFNNVSVHISQLKNGNTYTVAYPHQKYARSLSSYEDYDVLLLSGALSAQHFPTIRDTQIFSVPSVVGRTPKMVGTDIQNNIGAWEFNITYNKTGNLKRIESELLPYYTPSKKSYTSIKPLQMKLNEASEYISSNEKIINLPKNQYFDEIEKLYKDMPKEASFLNLMERYNMTESMLNGSLEMMKEYGKDIEIVDENNTLIVRKNTKPRRHYEVKPAKEELTKKSFLVVSDTHYGSIYSQPSMVNTAVYEAYNRGITDIFHVGDITDGDYSRVRPIHNYEVFLYGATGQLDYAVKTLPKYKGMNWYIITGSHDQTHLFNYGVDIGKELEKRRNDITFLGQDRGEFKYDNCKIELFHPGGGTSRILSTKPQNGIDQLPSKSKPNLRLTGHYHKAYYMMYRNIHTFLVPCNVAQSSFMMKNEIPNLMGDYFITIWYDDHGDIQYLETEPMIFTENEVREKDWENPKKYIRSKITK